MADWFKFYNDSLDSKGMQYALSEQPLVTSVWLVILSEASKNRSNKFRWTDDDYELIGFARKINVSVPVFNQSLTLLEKVKYILRKEGFIEIPAWDSMQSDYAKGLNRGYYKKTSEKLASNSEVSTVRREEKRGEESTIKPPIIPQGGNGVVVGFEDFWKAYPRKVGKEEARKAFIKKKCHELLPDILEGINRSIKSVEWTREGGKYVPHPSTWLNQGRWSDQPFLTKDAVNGNGHEVSLKRMALSRVEERIKVLKGQFPLQKGDPKIQEYTDLKVERVKLMNELQLKA